MSQSTYPPMQCTSEEMAAHVLPQLIPDDFERVGVRFAHASSDASCLFGPEVACGHRRNKESVVATQTGRKRERGISYSSVV